MSSRPRALPPSFISVEVGSGDIDRRHFRIGYAGES
jgi:hypothetical protein